MTHIKTIIVFLLFTFTVSNGKSLDDFAVCLANNNSQCLYKILDSLSKIKINEIKNKQTLNSSLERYIESLYKERVNSRYILLPDSIKINKNRMEPISPSSQSIKGALEYVSCQKLNVPNKICLSKREMNTIFEGLNMVFGDYYDDDRCVDYCGVPDLNRPIIDSLQNVMEITIVNAGGYSIMTTPEVKWLDMLNDTTYEIMIRDKYDQYISKTLIIDSRKYKEK